MELRVMTFNILHGLRYPQQDKIDLKGVADVIRKCGGDIVGLNEVRGEGPHEEFTNQVKAVADELGYFYYFAPALLMKGKDGIHGPYGNAIVSRYPISFVRKYEIPDPAVQDEDSYYETRCILKASFEIGGGFDVYVSHFGLAQSEKRNAVETLVDLVKEGGRPCVFMGDLNMMPDDPILRPVFEVMEDAAKGASEPMTWSSDNPSMKIDYIFTRNIQTKGFVVSDVTCSDHKPCYADIVLP